MRYLYQNTLLIRLPYGWRTEESGESLACFRPDGDGAVTISLHKAETGGESMYDYLKMLSERYRKHEIRKPTRAVITAPLRRGVLASSGEGVTKDGWHAASWFVSDGRTVAAFTYLCRERTREWYRAARIARRLTFIERSADS